MKKKWNVVMATALSLMMVLSGCGGGGESEQASQEAAETADPADLDYDTMEGDLLIWTFDAKFQEIYELAEKQIQETNPDFNLTVELLDMESLDKKFNTILLAGGEGGPDIIDIEEGTFGTYTKGSLPFVELDPYLEASGKKEDIVAGRLGQYSFDGKAYGVPRQLVPVTMVINTKALDEAGITYPWETWEDYTQAGVEYYEKTGNYLTAMTNNAGNWKNTIEVILKSTGEQMVAEGGSVNINTDEFKEVSEMIKDWCTEDNVAKVYENWTDYWAGFPNGEFASFYAADWTAANLELNVDPDTKGVYQHVPLPKLNENSVPTSAWGGTGACISKYSDNIDLAYKFLYHSWLDTDFSINGYTEFGNTPALHSALADESIQVPSEYFSGQNVMELYSELAQDLPTTRQSWWRPSIQEGIEQSWTEFYNGDIDVDEFTTNVETFVNEKIEENSAE